MNFPKATQRFFNPEQLAQFLGISTSSLAKWRITNRGPRFIKFGTRVVYEAADVEAYIAASKSRQNGTK